MPTFTLYALLGAVVTAFYFTCVPSLTANRSKAESPSETRPSQQPSLEDRSLLVLAAGRHLARAQRQRTRRRAASHIDSPCSRAVPRIPGAS